MAKRYYWLKLPDGFFRQKAIKKLRKIAGGDTYTIIYLKMLLVAMKQDGRLYFEGVEATFYDELENASTKVFGVPRECAVAAFKGCKKTEMTVAEAKQIIDRFMKKEVK